MSSPTLLEFQALLRSARGMLSDEEIASEFEISLRTLERWEAGHVKQARAMARALRDLLREEPGRVEPIRPGEFTFIDLFAGIGGTRLGFERAGGECIFTSEYDRFCQQTYRVNFRPSHRITGDIRAVTTSVDTIQAQVPDHDVLVAGFPCQPFSIAGVSKKNSLGHAHGFDCQVQGTLFFDIWKILKEKRPLAFLLENVRNLRSHDGGNTFRTIMSALTDLDYWIPDPQIIDARPWVPQHRERIFIVGFRKPTPFNLDLVPIPKSSPTLKTVLHPEDGSEVADGLYTFGSTAKVAQKYTLTKHLWNYLQRYREKHAAAGNGFGFGLVTPGDVARTLSARYFKDGSEILVSRGARRNPRRLTPRECARLMGFPDHFRIPVSDTQAYSQFGNSVVVPVVEAIAKAMKPHVLTLKAQENEQQLAMVV